MNRKMFSLGGLILGLMLVLPSAARADDYKADPVHSFVVFDVHHLQAGYVYGTFEGPTGAISYSGDNPTMSSFDLTVQTDSIDTRNKNRDKDLKGPDFFDAKQFPTIEFKSTSVSASSEMSAKPGEKMLTVTGDLTLKGVTKSITVPMAYTGTGQMMGQTRIGFRTEFTINRQDFGMVKDPPTMIANEIHIVVAIEAIKQ